MKHLYRGLFFYIIFIPSLTFTMSRQRRKAYFKANQYKIPEKVARQVFPGEKSLAAQLLFLRLFLYDHIKIPNRKRMVEAFIEQNNLPRKPIYNLIDGKHVKRKTFINKVCTRRKVGNQYYEREEAEELYNNLYRMLDRIEQDEKAGYSPSELYKTTMREIFPPPELSAESCEERSTQPEYFADYHEEDGIENTPRSLACFADPNPYEVLRLITVTG